MDINRLFPIFGGVRVDQCTVLVLCFIDLYFFGPFFGMASSICHRPKTQFIHFKSYLKKFKWKNKLFKAKSSNLAVTPHARFVNIRRIGATRIKHFISKKKNKCKMKCIKLITISHSQCDILKMNFYTIICSMPKYF